MVKNKRSSIIADGYDERSPLLKSGQDQGQACGVDVPTANGTYHTSSTSTSHSRDVNPQTHGDELPDMVHQSPGPKKKSSFKKFAKRTVSKLSPRNKKKRQLITPQPPTSCGGDVDPTKQSQSQAVECWVCTLRRQNGTFGLLPQKSVMPPQSSN